MNFLAHLYLAEPTPASLVGNILPDLARCRGEAGLHPDVLPGVRTHRQVDAFTDTHPLFHRSKARIFADHGRFSGILVDILYDHFLARDWVRYHDQPLTAFTRRVYDTFAEASHLMPESMRPAIAHMHRQDWLSTYTTHEGLRLTLRRMSRRFSDRFGREVVLETAVDTLVAYDATLAEDFHTFFPQLVQHIHAPKLEPLAARP